VATRTLTSQRDSFAQWYSDIVEQADLAEHGDVRGSMIIKPYGFAIWELLRNELDLRIRRTGHDNCAFPLLMPYSLLEREAELVEGFMPEVAVVTHAGGKELAEPLAIRPTSEALIWNAYARWIQSWRDLPLKLNQWANVVRWELRPRLFLRSTEFFWQEGHTAHETAAQAREEVLLILRAVYAATATEALALPPLLGRKTASERFPGAEETFTMELLLRDGRALQSATSHDLGQKFARTYGVSYLDRGNELAHPYGTSWGASARLLGAVVLGHGDDEGLRLPPAIAPHQVVIVPLGAADQRERVLAAARALRDEVAVLGLRVRIDDREHVRSGAKFHEWRRKGVPLVVDLGPRDIDGGQLTVTLRTGESAETVDRADAAPALARLLDRVHQTLLTEAGRFRDERTRSVATRVELEQAVADGGLVHAGWCGLAECEADVKAATSATIRCLPLALDVPSEDRCAGCGRAALEQAVWARAY
jgi:prolyl-tRNA synthetase